jgi:D-alanyl-D-alanine carboxypeptidase (penicillin-binding protein 5/6)
MDLLDYGFDNYKVDILKKKNDIVDYLNIDKANIKNVPVVVKEDLSILNKKTNKSINYDYKVELNDVSLPIKKNSIVGKISITDGNKIIKSSDLIVINDIKKIGYFKYLFDELLSFF